MTTEEKTLTCDEAIEAMNNGHIVKPLHAREAFRIRNNILQKANTNKEIGGCGFWYVYGDLDKCLMQFDEFEIIDEHDKLPVEGASLADKLEALEKEFKEFRKMIAQLYAIQVQENSCDMYFPGLKEERAEIMKKILKYSGYKAYEE